MDSSSAKRRWQCRGSRTECWLRRSIFEQLADTLQQATKDVADLLRATQGVARRLENAVYVLIGVSLVQFFDLIFVIFRKR